MRWLALHTRSRRVPAALGALLVVAVAVWWWAGRAEPGAALPAAALLTAGVAVLSGGLGSPDVALDRTAAIRWPVRRIGLVALVAGAAGAAVLVVLAACATGDGSVPLAAVLRNAAGMGGLAALGATVLGGPFAWAPPLGWLAVAVIVPRHPDTPALIATWMLRSADTPVATGTALVLGAAGTAIYAVLGPRR